MHVSPMHDDQHEILPNKIVYLSDFVALKVQYIICNLIHYLDTLQVCRTKHLIGCVQKYNNMAGEGCDLLYNLHWYSPVVTTINVNWGHHNFVFPAAAMATTVSEVINVHG